MEAVKISLSALDVEWARVQTIALNLANMNSIRSETGDVYRPVRLLSGPAPTFHSLLGPSGAEAAPSGVEIVGVEEIPGGVSRTYEPDSPYADADGFVVRTNIDHASEMTLMIKASRAYEANLTAMSIAQQMYTRALELGRQS